MADSDTEAAHVLFPNDAPHSEPPEYFNVAQSEAEQRLAGGHGDQPARVEQPEADAASILFKDEQRADYDEIMEGELDQYALSAIQDGDDERAAALQHATSALADDFRSNGTDADDLKEAFHIVRHSAGLAPPTEEQLEGSYAAGMAAIQSEGITDADLGGGSPLRC